MKKKKDLSKHHIIPKSRLEEFKVKGINIDNKDNIKYLKTRTHDALHRLFSNKTPKEQLETRYKINGKMLSNYVKKILIDLIFLLDDKDFYK